jgi:hypothetical protein
MHQIEQWLEQLGMSEYVRLWSNQGKRNEARDLLATVHGWFTEGLDTFDLREAKALLEQLTS